MQNSEFKQHLAKVLDSLLVSVGTIELFLSKSAGSIQGRTGTYK